MIVIGMIASIAAAIWLAVILRHGGMLSGALLVIFAGSVLGYPFFHVSMITLDRVLWAVLMGAFVVDRMRGLSTNTQPYISTDLILITFLAVLTASTLTHEWKYDGAQPASRLLFLYLMPAGIFWVASQTKLSNESIRSMLACCTVFGCYLSLTAIAEVSALHQLVLPRYIVADTYDEFLGRGRGPFLNPSANGIYIATCLAALWMYWPVVQNTGRGWIIVGTCLMFAGALATLTRCVWLGVACGSMAVMWLTFPKQKRLGVAILVISCGVLTVSTQWDKLSAFKRDKNVSVSDMAKSASLRPMLAAVAWQIFSDHPLSGVGFGQYKQHDKLYIARRNINLPLDQVRPYHQHNVILSLLTEVGLLGTIPFVILLIGWARTALRLWWTQSASLIQRQVGLVFLVCLINYVINGAFQDVALIPMVNLVLFFFGGVLSSVAKSCGVGFVVRPEFGKLSVPMTAGS